MIPGVFFAVQFPPVQPPASLQPLADPIYEAFYGLKEQPFATSTDPKFLFMSASHHRAFEELVTGLRRREALLLLCGETGTGKTTLCRGVLEALGDRTFSAIILNPYMTGAEILRVILRDFGFISREEIRRGAFAQADAPQLLDALEGFLHALLPLDAHAIVVIDEAQSLQPQVLDQIRMLTAFEDEGRRLVQVVLVGQPMLLNTLKTEPLYALNERITRRAMLSPLERSEVESYIKHRLEIAGAGESVNFEPDAARLVADLSRGLPRRINVICDRTLQEGRIQGASELTIDHVKRAARSLTGVTEPVAQESTASVAPEIETSSPGRRFLQLRLAAILVAASLILTTAGYGYVARDIIRSDAHTPEPPPALHRERVLEAHPRPVPSEAELLTMFLPGEGK